MRKSNDKLTHAAHIKRNTRGTSNELSFSVLDAAKNALDEGKDVPSDQVRGFGRIRLFTLPLGLGKKPAATPKKDGSLPVSSGAALPPASSGTPEVLKPPRSHAESVAAAASAGAPSAPVASASAFSRSQARSGRTSQEEIAWRKGRRRKRRVAAAALCVLLLVGLAAAGVLYLYNDTLHYQQNAERLGAAAEDLASTDQLLLELDDALQDPLGEEAAAFLDSQGTALDAAEGTLKDVGIQASAATEGLRETEEREAADALMTGSSARLTMLREGRAILEDGVAAAELYDTLADTWQNVVDADELGREAAELASQDSQDAIGQSKEKTQQAYDALVQARSDVAYIEQQVEGMDLSAHLAYLDKKIESFEYALASDEALQNRDTATAVEKNDAYNEADRAAAELAAALPEDPAQPVLDAYEDLAASAIESYEAARSQASTSDAFLRDYLGSSGK